MAQNSKIEWCHHTANIWWGCEEVHAGCDHCYARVFARAKGKGAAWEGTRFTTKSVWSDLLKWQAAAKAAGEIARVFCGSMMDIFEKSRPASDWQGRPLDGVSTGDLRDRFFREVIPATPDLLYLLLTKRPSNIPKMVPAEWLKDWPANVMTGASVVNQATADTLVPQLLASPGPHFLSMEPMIGPVDLGRIKHPVSDPFPECAASFNCLTLEAKWEAPGLSRRVGRAGRIETAKVDWVIVGGESGPGSRPFEIGWARSIRDQCEAAGVPCFVKQMGANVACRNDEVSGWFEACGHLRLGPTERFQGAVGRVLGFRDPKGGDWSEWPEDLRVREFPRVPNPEVAR